MPSPPPLDYRAPDTPPLSRRARIVRQVRQHLVMDTGAIVLRVSLGVPLTLAAPLLVAGVLHGACDRFDVPLPVPFAMTAVLLAMVIVPILMRVERVNRGDYFLDGVRGLERPGKVSSRGEWELNQSLATWHGLVEVALTGPRLLWEAIDQLRGRTGISDADAGDAAGIVERLFEAGRAVAVQELVSPERPAANVRRAIGLLKHLDWADASADGRRVWLRSDAARRLEL